MILCPSSHTTEVQVDFLRFVTGQELIDTANLIAECPSWGFYKMKHDMYYEIGQISDHTSDVVTITPMEGIVWRLHDALVFPDYIYSRVQVANKVILGGEEGLSDSTERSVHSYVDRLLRQLPGVIVS